MRTFIFTQQFVAFCFFLSHATKFTFIEFTCARIHSTNENIYIHAAVCSFLFVFIIILPSSPSWSLLARAGIHLTNENIYIHAAICIVCFYHILPNSPSWSVLARMCIHLTNENVYIHAAIRIVFITTKFTFTEFTCVCMHIHLKNQLQNEIWSRFDGHK